MITLFAGVQLAGLALFAVAIWGGEYGAAEHNSGYAWCGLAGTVVMVVDFLAWALWALIV